MAARKSLFSIDRRGRYGARCLPFSRPHSPPAEFVKIKFNQFLMIQNHFFSTICIGGKMSEASGKGPCDPPGAQKFNADRDPCPRALTAFDPRGFIFPSCKKENKSPPSKGNGKTNNRPLRAPYCYSQSIALPMISHDPEFRDLGYSPFHLREDLFSCSKAVHYDS